MEDCCKDGSCGSKQSTKEKCGSSGCQMTDMLVGLADRAWEELMLEKMKRLIEERNGEKMDRVARAGVDASFSFWEHKMGGMAGCEESKRKVQEAFRS